MKVFKFGGASLKDPAAIRNAAGIVRSYRGSELLVVVSAMGKTTNALEKILQLYTSGQDHTPGVKELRNYHLRIMQELFEDLHPVYRDVEQFFLLLNDALTLSYPYDQLYDQVISIGELVSSTIVNHFFNAGGISSRWADARQYICTDEHYREARVDWHATTLKVRELKPLLAGQVVLTQGFIGGTAAGLTTTLGREGSDFSAAIFACCLDASSATIWKDVPGVMNADPKRLPAAIVFKELPYQEAAEMTYYGASVIHPKTIKPLANKGIPLYVKCFDDPSLPGTLIHECHVDHLPPLTVFKENQCLVSCRVTDYTFINEYQLGTIFHVLSALDMKINVMQNSAISFSFCVDYRESKVDTLIKKLQENFEVHYNTGLTLITVKNYSRELFDSYLKKEGLMLEQSSRSTLQVLVANNMR